MFRSAGTTPRRSVGLTGLPVVLVEPDLVTVTLVVAPELRTPHQEGELRRDDALMRPAGAVHLDNDHRHAMTLPGERRLGKMAVSQTPMWAGRTRPSSVRGAPPGSRRTCRADRGAGLSSVVGHGQIDYPWTLGARHRDLGIGGAGEHLGLVVVPQESEAKRMTFGEITGIPEGTTFASREDIRRAGLHRHTIAGISGAGASGADAIVLNGGYEDDEDHGDLIIYTGEGGNRAGHQVADQSFTKGNRALGVSSAHGIPVRVIRGYRHASPHAPKHGYRYDGLWRVDDYWSEPGLSGFRVYRYRLVKQGTDAGAVSPPAPPGGNPQPARREVTTSRVVRDTAVTRSIKELYDYQCQVCGTRLVGSSGPYAEGAHIRPLGKPHNGPDVPENVLCLCPNHHALLDLGGFSISDDLSLVGVGGKLTVHPGHVIDVAHLRYHRDHYWQS